MPTAGSSVAGDLRLSLLLSQLVGSQEVRELLALQLADWRQLQADGFIQDERLRIFCLLAGKPVSRLAPAFFPSHLLLWLLSLFQPLVSLRQVWQLSEKRTINVCSQLDWKRSLGVHLWYLLPSTAPLSKALSVYEAAFQVGSRWGRPGQPGGQTPVCIGSLPWEESGQGEELGLAFLRPRRVVWESFGLSSSLDALQKG